MKVTVRLFASQREAAGTGTLDMEFSNGTSAGDAFAQLCQRYPVLAAAAGSTAFAVNRRHVEPTAKLADGDELALLPPVAGG